MTALDIATDFIKKAEGCRLKAYKDSVGIWTIGYGHTGGDVKPDTEWTQKQADDVLLSDVIKVAKRIDELVSTAPVNQKAALISFAFNVGTGALATSTLMTKMKQGDTLGAAKEFQRWDHAGAIELKGLLIRRLKEAVLFLGG